MKPSAHRRIILSLSLVTLTIIPACHGRNVRVELLQFARVVEKERARSYRLSNAINNLPPIQSKTEIPVIKAKLDNTIADIDDMLKSIKSLDLKTEEVQSLKGEYLRAWESMRDALALMLKVITTRDKKLAMTMISQLKSRMASYQQTAKAFERNYKQLRDQYNITKEELGLAGSAPPPSPAPFTPQPR